MPEVAQHHPDPRHDTLAQAAIAGIESGMIVGLGTGKSSWRAMRALALKIKEANLDIDCVCTSVATQQEAVALGLPVIPADEVEEVDHLFDGASEVDPQFRMLKGQFAAITRQRLIAAIATRRIYMADEERFTQRLGTQALLSVTIIPFTIAAIRSALRELGLVGVVRRTMTGEVFYSDGGGVVLDMRLPERPVEELAELLDHVPGVVDHGIFLTECQELLIESRSGDVRRVRRES
jgi:ribose 5-phosphate isomerase A